MSIQPPEKIDSPQELIDMYLNLPFHQFLGLQLESLENDRIVLRFSNQPSFIGNAYKSILSGGVVSSVIDACGGLLALASGLEKLGDLPAKEKIKRLSQSSTIDLRVDYLRPGLGESFTVAAELLRSGKRITVTRMKVLNEKSTLIAAGTATYQIGKD